MTRAHVSILLQVSVLRNPWTTEQIIWTSGTHCLCQQLVNGAIKIVDSRSKTWTLQVGEWHPINKWFYVRVRKNSQMKLSRSVHSFCYPLSCPVCWQTCCASSPAVLMAPLPHRSCLAWTRNVCLKLCRTELWIIYKIDLVQANF